MIIAIDFDGTIVKDNKYPSLKYELQENCKEVLNNLSKKHQLVLCTARRTWYFIPAVIFIKKHKLPVKIYYGKPFANVYIDDKNLNCNKIDWLEIEKEINNECNRLL